MILFSVQLELRGVAIICRENGLAKAGPPPPSMLRPKENNKA